MKGIIMAGGEGTRLRPINGLRPKPMVKIADKPILEHIITLLRENDIYDICIILGYMADAIMDYFGDGSGFGVSIKYMTEDKPMGTAGSVRRCTEFIGDSDVLIISADCICDWDLKGLLRAHRGVEADATIAVSPSRKPRGYGNASIDTSGQINSFVDRPEWDTMVTDRVSSGIYILKSEAVALIPYGREYDFAKELFPQMIKGGKRVYAEEAGGYWCNIGTCQDFINCCRDVLNGDVKLGLDAPEVRMSVWSNSVIPENITIIP